MVCSRSNACAIVNRTLTCRFAAFAESASIVGSSASPTPAISKNRDAKTSGRTVWFFYHTTPTDLDDFRLGEAFERPCGDRRFAFLGFYSAKNLLDESRVERVTGLVRRDLADYRPADERQVADQIEDLVADEPVAGAEAAGHHAPLLENHAVLDRNPARENRRPALLDL